MALIIGRNDIWGRLKSSCPLVLRKYWELIQSLDGINGSSHGMLFWTSGTGLVLHYSTEFSLLVWKCGHVGSVNVISEVTGCLSSWSDLSRYLMLDETFCTNYWKYFFFKIRKMKVYSKFRIAGHQIPAGRDVLLNSRSLSILWWAKWSAGASERCCKGWMWGLTQGPG